MPQTSHDDPGEGCIGAEQALRLIDGDLGDDEREHWLLHIDECAACRKYVSELTRVMLHGSTSGTAPPATAVDIELGSLASQVIGGTYRLERILGSGSMGVVYEARHERLPRAFAVKVLRRGDEQARDRFRREARIAAELDHRNVARVVDYGVTPEGYAYLVMDRLEGESLAARIAKLGRLDVPSALGIAESIAAALDAAHARGVVHRDVKPSNVFLALESDDTETVKLLDFGVSKALDTITRTQGDVLIGTPQYMAPEQARGLQDVDRRADVFALAAVIYHMLAGRPPFEGDSLEAVLYQIVHEPAPSLGRLVPDLPSELDAAVRRGMSKRAEDRYSSAGALVRGCRGSVQPGSRIGRRRMLLPGGVALIVGLVIIGAAGRWFVSIPNGGSGPRAQESPVSATTTMSVMASSMLAPSQSVAMAPASASSSPRAVARPARSVGLPAPSASGKDLDRMLAAWPHRRAAQLKARKRDASCMEDLARARQLDPEHEGLFEAIRAECLAAAGRCDEGTALARRQYAESLSGPELEHAIDGFRRVFCAQ